MKISTRWAGSALALVLLTSPPIAAQVADPAQQLPVDSAVRVGTLSNGLRYYVPYNPEPMERAELRLVVKAGSVLEDEDQRGLAHFVEHMAFNGTENFAKQELVDYLEGIGMRFGPDLNAYTSFDETVYMLKVPTDSADLVTTAFQILEDWAHALSFDPEEIDKERGVVVEEWRLGRGAGARIFDRQFPILFQGSRYADRLVIGDKEVLENFDYEALKRFYRDWYRPDLMAVVAVGDFETAVIEELIKEHFGGLTSPAGARERPIFPVPDHEEPLFAIASDPEYGFNNVAVYWKQPLRDGGTLAAYRQAIVESLFNQMLGQRLFELSQQADPPFLGASSGQGRFIGPKEVYFLGAGVADNGIERGLEALLTEAERVARFGFTESELEREKRELLRAIERAYAERAKTESATYAAEYARNFLYEEPIPGVAYEYELHKLLVPGVILEEVNRLAREWITERNRVVLVSIPEKEGLAVPTEDDLLAVFDAVAAAEITAYTDAASDAPLVPEPPQPAEITAVEDIEEIGVWRWELANGVRVLLKPTDFKDDEVLVRAWSPGGSSLASDENYVAATTATSVITQGGAGSFDLIGLQKALAGKAVRVSPFIGSLEEGISGSVAPADIETLFQLVYLYFTAPRRDTTAFASFKTRIQAFLANRDADPMAAWRDTLSVTMAQGHFRARPPSKELYDEMDLDASYAFYRDRFADASDFTFVFVGSFEPDSLQPLIRTYLGGLPSLNRAESWRDEGILPPKGVIVKEVYKGIEPKSQTQITFTGPFEWTRDNRYIIRALASVLRIRLREVLREDMGGTYGVGVGGRGGREPREEYTFTISFGTAPERLPELSQAVFDEIEILKRDGPTQQDIDKVREIQRRERETQLRENGFWLGQLLAYERAGLDPREIVTYDELVAGLTAEKIREAAVLYLRRDNYVQVSLFPEEPTGDGD
ncbi:MAG: insulinase family protein [Gemmatimonadota bacterium]|nr:MAG: insulinase family protein [Gemmatimonadota bacterium]